MDKVVTDVSVSVTIQLQRLKIEKVKAVVKRMLAIIKSSQDIQSGQVHMHQVR